MKKAVSRNQTFDLKQLLHDFGFPVQV